MDDRAIEPYLRELIRQAQNAEFSVTILNDALRKDAIADPNKKVNLTFYALAGLLSHSANMAKLIWGSQNGNKNKEFRKARLQKLQQILSIDRASPLASTSMRNNLEHFDERLDEWSTDPDTRGGMVDGTIGAKDAVFVSGSSPRIFIRNYEPKRKTMTFFDQEIDIQALVVEVGRVKELAENELQRISSR